jgi:single-stranded-DNA-specific exonuclease
MQALQPKKWDVLPVLPVEIDTALDAFSPFMRQLLFNRGVINSSEAERYLNGAFQVEDPFQLTDMEAAVDRLLRAADANETVAVYGDYDVDGVTATALMTEVLESLGARVFPYIPNRFEEGYGLNREAIQILADSGIKIILTVDCGIRSLSEADLARELGVDLIISDHHHPKHEIPQALAVICPKRKDDSYGYKEMSGVGLAYKIAQALFERRKVNGRSADDWLDLVALGTVSDIVPLTGENRILVKRGLQLIRQGSRLGLGSLLRVARRDPTLVTASDIGFMLGPRLNAAGRMESAMEAYHLLVTRDIFEAGVLAQKLDNQNSGRQELTKDLQSWVVEKVGDIEGRYLISDFSLADFDYSTYETPSGSGIMGLVASRLVENYYRPAIIGTVEEGVIKASCRSIPEFHITNALDECSELLVRHGGHSMAAGFTVKLENRDLLVERLNQIAERELAPYDLVHTLKADMEISLDDLPTNALVELRKLEPTGQENPEARFISRNIQPKDIRKIGKDLNHLKFKVPFHGGWQEAVAWKQGEWGDKVPERIDIFYAIEENYFNGRVTTQLNVKDIKPSVSHSNVNAAEV